jgi:hypothetical protein
MSCAGRYRAIGFDGILDASAEAIMELAGTNSMLRKAAAILIPSPPR